MTHLHRILGTTGLVTALSLLALHPRNAFAQDRAPDRNDDRTAIADHDVAAEEAAARAELRAEEERARREAQDDADREAEWALAREPRDAEDDDVYARFELTMGFVGGYASYADLGFSGMPALPTSAFSEGPAAGTAMAGLRYDVRLVIAFLRMTVGGDLSWGVFRAGPRAIADGTTVSDRRVFDGALRFGLGLEANVDGVRLFADVLGTVHFVDVEIAQENASTYHAVAFSPGLRLGVRIPVVPHFFVQVSADGSPFGPSWIGGDVSVGGAIE